MHTCADPKGLRQVVIYCTGNDDGLKFHYQGGSEYALTHHLCGNINDTPTFVILVINLSILAFDEMVGA